MAHGFTRLLPTSGMVDDSPTPTAVPSFASYSMVYDQASDNWDFGRGARLFDLDTGGGTELVLGVNLRTGGSGASSEIGVTANPIINRPDGASTVSTDTVAAAQWGNTYNYPMLYNAVGNSYARAIQAQLTYSNAGVANTGIPAVAIYGFMDDTSTDLAAENKFHTTRITQYRALHTNPRDASGNELLESSEITLLASAARTTTQTSADITNYNGCSALVVVLDMTVVGTGSVTISIDGKDSASGKYYNILTGAAVITNSTNRYRVGRNLAAAANSVAQDYLPRVFRIVVTANNANSATYSVGYCLVK